MKNRYLQSFLLLLFCSLFTCSIYGQEIVYCSYIDNMPGKEPMPKNVRERLMTLCIEENKKEFNKLIEYSEEVAKLSKEIEDSYTENNKLSKKDQGKLKQVEKLLNKIRKELRANDEDDDDEVDEPSSTVQAIKDLQSKTSNLLDEIKKTTRHTISAVAIQSSNAVLKIVKFLRFK